MQSPKRQESAEGSGYGSRRNDIVKQAGWNKL